jgi:hypothetical protein
MPDPDIERIPIVGGGIAWRSVATAPHRQRLTPEFVGRSAAWPAIGAGINLPTNGVLDPSSATRWWPVRY